MFFFYFGMFDARDYKLIEMGTSFFERNVKFGTQWFNIIALLM